MPEERTVTKWFAFDGTEHSTREEAEAHEEANYQAILVGLTAQQIAAGENREPGFLHISDALEKAGTKAANKRRASGELRRRPKDKGEPEPQGEPAPEGEKEAS